MFTHLVTRYVTPSILIFYQVVTVVKISSSFDEWISRSYMGYTIRLPSSYVYHKGYHFPDHKFGGEKIVYVEDDLIVKILNDLEINISENVSLELTISNKKYFKVFA